jgi:hypothetical protein
MAKTHADMTASIAADMRKGEALAIERGLVRRCADGRVEVTEAGRPGKTVTDSLPLRNAPDTARKPA